MRNYYFPVTMLLPDKEEPVFNIGRYGLVRRKWDVSMFDLATLQTKHHLHMSYDLMSTFLKSCSLEFKISASSFSAAAREARLLKALLYIDGCAPFTLPLGSTHSVNDYAGINSRDSELLRDSLPPELKKGLTSDSETVEIWPLELVFNTLHEGIQIISSSMFEQAIKNLKVWSEISERSPVLESISNALITAPMIIDSGQSLLHIWTAIESLFPNVNQEVSFRISIYLTQLYDGEMAKKSYFELVKKAYSTRSKVAHGTKRNVNIEEWRIAWRILIDACHSILSHGQLPNEEEMLSKLFG